MAAAQFVVHRRRRKETTVDNSIIWDKGLSNMARFVLIAILSLPETWDYSVRGMAAMLEVSKDTMGKYLRELEASGYLRRQQGEDKGKFSKSVYIITDTPGDFGDDEDAPCPKNYDSDCPNFSAPKKSPQKNVKVLENNIPPKSPKGGKRGLSTPKWRPDKFEQFWDYYRTHARGDDRAGAAREWDRLKPDDDLLRIMGQALAAHVRSDDWRRGYIPYARTWLHNRRWEDTVRKPTPPAGATPGAGGDEECMVGSDLPQW